MAHPKRRPSYGKELFYIIGIFAIALTAALAVWGPGGYLELKRAQAHVAEQGTRVEAVRQSNQERMRTIQALRSDRATIERLARRRNFGRQGEIIQQLPRMPDLPQQPPSK